MPLSDLCAPLDHCQDLDGRLLLRRAFYGPQLVFDPGPLPLGAVTARGASLRPFLDLDLLVRWVPKELCYAPIASVMGLAPGEVVTAALRTRRTFTFTSLVRDAVESSAVSTHTRTTTTESTHLTPSGRGGAGGGGGGGWDVLGEMFDEIAEAAGDVIEIAPMFAASYGSWVEDAFTGGGAIAGGALGGPAGALVGGFVGHEIGSLVDNAIGSGGGSGAAPGPVLVDTFRRLDEVVDALERRESQNHLRQTNVSTTVESEESIVRTFSNPYRDRTLQLRFVPVFHRFEIVTTIFFARVGLAAVLVEPEPARAAVASNVARITASQVARVAASTSPAPLVVRSLAAPAVAVSSALDSAQRRRDEDSLRLPLVELLRRSSAGADRTARIEGGLAWSATEARANAVHVPLAEPKLVASAWGLKAAERDRLVKAVERLKPGKIDLLLPKPIVRSIHVYAGTHVEAVPGECRLPDIPEDYRVVIPERTD